jgi:hypothetical protein
MKKLFISVFLILVIVALIFYFRDHTKKGIPVVTRVSETLAPVKVKSNEESRAHYHYYEYERPPSTGDSHAYSRSSSYPQAAAPSNGEAPQTDNKTAEQLLKYVLFSVKYDPKINAGETESLQLSMSPRNKLLNLQKALSENKINQNQINDIEKVGSQYKYVSAKLLSQNNCLYIEKKMPEEDKVYLPSITESSGDQIWQWDLTAPHTPSTTVCHLSLFIRFCINQHDCVPLADPDKEFNIYIEITVAHKIYTWLSSTSHLASIIIPILTIIGIIGGLVWRKKQSKIKIE